MTSFAAYDENLPCKNPACKSQGKPHPNCKCYSMAEGGEVKPFCSETRMHKPKCQYAMKLSELLDQDLKPEDPNEAVNGYMAHKGMNGLLNNPDDLDGYNNASDKGNRSIDSHVKALFSGKEIPKRENNSRDAIDKWISKGAINNLIQEQKYKQAEPVQQFAEGGKVEKSDKLENPIAENHPSQNILLQASKGMIGNYLQGLKPQKDTPRLAFDHAPDQRMQQKSYEKALEIADHPLSVLRKIQNGTIEPEHVQHFNAMFPELNNHLQKKLTDQITQAQLDGKKPPFTTRQGLSLLMGTPLSSEMTPANIIAAQGALSGAQNKSQSTTQSPQPGKNKKSTSALSKSDQAFLTGNQSLVARQQKQ